MDKRYRHILRYALAAVPLACVALLSSCSFDDDYDGSCDSGAPVAVRINVSAGEPGDLNGTRAGDDVNADEHEFMHTLRLYIVNDNDNGVRRTVLDLSPDLTNNTLAQTGDLTNYETGELTLAPGTYTIYAFANVDGYDGEFGTESGQRAITQMTMTEFLNDCFAIDQQVRDGDLAEYRIYNPAENLYFANGMYIPMSAKKTITITPNTRDISIGLDRLVSKVRITVPDNQYVSTSSTITFSGYSENVPLLGADNGGYGDAQLYGGTATTDKMPFNQVGEDVSFYVNETPGGNPFTVTLSTGKSGNGDVSAYVAKTQRADIPRNSIYPLVLTLDDYGLDIRVQCWVSPIGSYPVPVVATLDPNTYEVKLPEGAQFQFDIDGVYTGETATEQPADMACTWSFDPSAVRGLAFDDYTPGSTTVAGHVTASAGQEIPLTAQATWTDDGQSYNRTYTLRVFTTDITDVEFQAPGTTRAASSRWLDVEVLNMYSYK